MVGPIHGLGGLVCYGVPGWRPACGLVDLTGDIGDNGDHDWVDDCPGLLVGGKTLFFRYLREAMKIHLQKEAIPILRRMADEAGVGMADMVEVAVYNLIGLWMQERGENVEDSGDGVGDGPVSGR